MNLKGIGQYKVEAGMTEIEKQWYIAYDQWLSHRMDPVERRRWFAVVNALRLIVEEEAEDLAA